MPLHLVCTDVLSSMLNLSSANAEKHKRSTVVVETSKILIDNRVQACNLQSKCMDIFSTVDIDTYIRK